MKTERQSYEIVAARSINTPHHIGKPDTLPVFSSDGFASALEALRESVKEIGPLERNENALVTFWNLDE